MKPRCPEDRPEGANLYTWILASAAAERLQAQQAVQELREQRDWERLAARPPAAVRREPPRKL